MVADGVAYGLLAAQFIASVITFLIVVRIVFVLSANPIGEFTQELVYLRGRDLRRAGLVLFLVLLLELAQLLYPFTIRQGWLRDVPDAPLFVDTSQAILILAASAQIVLVVRRYTHRALDRRIRESMETLAYLESQRRRRRAVEAGQWAPPADDE